MSIAPPSRTFAQATRRRFLLGAAVTAAAATAFGVAAQSVPRLAFMAQIRRPDPMDTHIFGSFVRGLRDAGYVDGRNLALEWHFADGDVQRLPSIAAAIVHSRPDIVVTAGTLSAVAMHKATASLPIVFGNVSDPLGTGLVKALNRPGTNLTGMSNFSVDMMPKLADVLLETLPRAGRFGLLMNPLQVAHRGVPESVAPLFARRGSELRVYRATSGPEIEAAFARMSADRLEAVLMPLEGLFIQQRAQIGALSLKHRIPAAGIDSELANAGGLVAYGADQHVMFRRMAQYVDRILKGARPQELPVEQPSGFVLAVNRRTARALGIEIPQAVLVRADQVVE